MTSGQAAVENQIAELWAVVPAAGHGSRMPSTKPKQYLALNGRTLLQRAVETLCELPNISGVIVVLSEGDSLWPTLSVSKNAKVKTTIGGATRAESVVAGVKMVCENAQSEQSMVLVHDAARAMTALDDITRLVDRVSQAPEQGGLLAVKVQDTLKRGSSTQKRGSSTQSENEEQHTNVSATVSRDDLWQAQTPQMFQANLLLDSLMKNADAIAAGDITDEACAMERSGYAPALVEAIEPNFKITHARDFDMALALIEQREHSGKTSV